MCILGLLVTPFVYVLTLNDIVVRSRLLQKVIESVTINIESLTLTFVFIIIVIYHFTLIGQLYFRDDFLFHLPSPKVRAVRESAIRPMISQPLTLATVAAATSQ
jgi:hypothetical protein